MALIRKTLPKGIDEAIDKLQQQIYSKISWVNFNYDCNPRAYKNESSKGIIYELYKSSKEYQDALYNDNFDCKSFFIVDDNVKLDDKRYKVDVTMIVQIDLETCYSSIPHRADEEAHQELRNIVKSNPYGFTPLNLITGLKNVFREINIDPIKYTDMQPRHIFAITFALDYECCGC